MAGAGAGAEGAGASAGGAAGAEGAEGGAAEAAEGESVDPWAAVMAEVEAAEAGLPVPISDNDGVNGVNGAKSGAADGEGGGKRKKDGKRKAKRQTPCQPRALVLAPTRELVTQVSGAGSAGSAGCVLYCSLLATVRPQTASYNCTSCSCSQ